MIRPRGRLPRPRLRRPLLFAPVPGLALALLCLSSCASSGGRASDLPPKSVKLLGTITFHDPSPARGSFVGSKAPRAPATISFATTPRVEEEGQDDEVDSGTVVSKGRIGEGFDGSRPLSPEVTRQIFQHSLSQSPHQIVSPGQLAGIWRNLIDEGIEALPRLEGATPPADSAYIRVDTGSRTLFFLEPATLTRHETEATGREKKRKLEIWARCKLAVTSGTLRTNFLPGLRTNSSP